MNKIIVLLDVDDTSVLSNTLFGQHDGGYRYNEALFSALKSQGLCNPPLLRESEQATKNSDYLLCEESPDLLSGVLQKRRH